MTTEQHIVAEPPNDLAWAQAHVLILNRLSAWLVDERMPLDPSSDRWRALADVSEAIHQLVREELSPR
jgi:hypothetical protein